LSSQVAAKQLESTSKRKQAVVDSLESEIELLNRQLSAFSKDRSRRQSIAYVDAATIIQDLESTNQKLESSLASSLSELSQSHARIQSLETSNLELETALASAQVRVSLVEATLQHSDGVSIPEDDLGMLQRLWDELGTSAVDRDSIRHDIENCLQGTCQQKINELRTREQAMREDLRTLQAKVTEIEKCLHLSISPRAQMGGEPLHKVHERVLLRFNTIESLYDEAIQRREAITKQVNGLLVSLGPDELSDELKAMGHPSGPMDNDLSDAHLSRCEEELFTLRLCKSKIVVGNALLRADMAALVTEMSISADEVAPLVKWSMQQRHRALPDWWNNIVADSVVRAIVDDREVVRVTRTFTRHMDLVNEALQSVAKKRHVVSTVLRAVIERAQNVLLETVSDSTEAIDVCTTIHDTLLLLPPLSKERIDACIAEVKALGNGVETMIQSEIEALTVVWEAMAVASSERGQFWRSVRDAAQIKKRSSVGPFEEVTGQTKTDVEPWVLLSVEGVTEAYFDLEDGLFRLERIHKEVEILRSQQDTKSQIISLDSEIRILNAQLSEFEEKKCDKQRLLSKKAGGSNLLKEERFRKQMQSKFSSKMAQLATLLKLWKSTESREFDPNLLSDEVRDLLLNTDKMDFLVEQRTEFMHLRTVKAKKKRDADEEIDRNVSKPNLLSNMDRRNNSTTVSRQKRPLDHDGTAADQHRQLKVLRSVKNHSSLDVPPGKASMVKSRRDQREAELTSPLAHILPDNSDSKPPTIETNKTKRKRLTLPPFGHVLAQVTTPRNRKTNGKDQGIA
jgi:Microtubule associated protein (MAP65/ASE1 family)